jgi:phage shock protein A
MTTVFFAFLGLGAVLLCGVMLTKKGRILLKSFFGIFFQDAMQNPKMIEQVFNQKIDKLRDVYTRANKACQQAHGKLRSTKKKIDEAGVTLKESQNKMTLAHNRGDTEAARIFGREAMLAQSTIESLSSAIPGLEQAVKASETLRDRSASAIAEIESQKTTQIAKAELGKAQQEIYNSFDPNHAASTIDKILADYSKFADRQEEMGMGAEAAWENSPEAQKIEAQKRAADYSVDAYLEEFLKSNKNSEVSLKSEVSQKVK